MIHYIADCHFYHGALNTKMDKRGFESVEAMNEYMIRKWNDKVTNADTVIILGDLSLGTVEQTNELIHKLKGKLCLIVGNHDKYLGKEGFDLSRFEWIDNYREITDSQKKVVSTGKDIMVIQRATCSMCMFMRPEMKNLCKTSLR